MSNKKGVKSNTLQCTFTISWNKTDHQSHFNPFRWDFPRPILDTCTFSSVHATRAGVGSNLDNWHLSCFTWQIELFIQAVGENTNHLSSANISVCSSRGFDVEHRDSNLLSNYFKAKRFENSRRPWIHLTAMSFQVTSFQELGGNRAEDRLSVKQSSEPPHNFIDPWRQKLAVVVKD